MTKKILLSLPLLSCALLLAPALAVAQAPDSSTTTPKQDIKDAGKDTAHAVTKTAADKTAQGTKVVAEKTKQGTETAAHKTAEGTKPAAEKTKEGAKTAA